MVARPVAELDQNTLVKRYLVSGYSYFWRGELDAVLDSIAAQEICPIAGPLGFSHLYPQIRELIESHRPPSNNLIPFCSLQPVVRAIWVKLLDIWSTKTSMNLPLNLLDKQQTINCQDQEAYRLKYLNESTEFTPLTLTGVSKIGENSTEWKHLTWASCTLVQCN